MPVYQPAQPSADPGSLVAMAQSNQWPLAHDLPALPDGRPVDISGGPFAPGRWRVAPPVALGRAGHWPFFATNIAAMTRAGEWATYAVTAIMLPGPLPYVHCYPESWRASATSVVPEVHLEYGEFNHRFATFAKDPRTAYAVLSPRTMQALVDTPPLDELWTAGPQVCLARLDGHAATTLDAHLRLLTVCAGDMASSAWEPPAPPRD